MCTVNNRRTIKPVDPLLKSFNVPGMINQKLYVQHTKEYAIQFVVGDKE